MLVLPRRGGQTISIDDGRITIHVLQLRGDHVRIGIDAPRDVSVHRGEVQECIDAQRNLKKGDRP